jgi:hypothetical protein
VATSLGLPPGVAERPVTTDDLATAWARHPGVTPRGLGTRRPPSRRSTGCQRRWPDARCVKGDDETHHPGPCSDPGDALAPGRRDRVR